MHDEHPPRRLDSWKAIADYLGRDIRTAMRWHANDGLPVHRIGGSRGRAVFAFTNEIDRWLAGGRAPAAAPPVAAEPRPRWTSARVAWVVALVLAVLAAGGGAWWWRGVAAAPGLITRASLVGDAVVALDSGAREVWRFQLPHLIASESEQHVRVADVDGDGRPDVVASIVPWQVESSTGESELILVDSTGRLRWRRTLRDHVAFDGVDYGPPWYLNALIVYSVAGQARITGAFHHHTWWPDLVVTYDADGGLLHTFVNAGWIYDLALTADGRQLLASGVNNALGGAVLAALDVSRPAGTSPRGPESPLCGNCPDGQPDRYVLWPRSDLADPAQSPPAIVFVGPDGTLEVHAIQRRLDGGPELVTRLSPTFTVLHRSVSDSFRALHRRLEHEGGLAHPLAACPWVTPPMRSWTPGEGWQDVK
jgi:hypothetical protein